MAKMIHNTKKNATKTAPIQKQEKPQEEPAIEQLMQHMDQYDLEPEDVAEIVEIGGE